MRSADKIREEMRHVRSEIAEDMDDVVESAREMTDWRLYVRRYPWVCLGAATAIGFLAVPRRIQIVSPDVDSLLELAKKNKLVVNTNPKAQAKSGLTGSLLSILATSAVRAAIGFVGQKVGKASGEMQEQSDSTLHPRPMPS